MYIYIFAHYSEFHACDNIRCTYTILGKKFKSKKSNQI